jgi:hypothetical protein
LKYFNHGKNIIISIWDKDWYYINQTDADWVINPSFTNSIKNFAAKPASLKIEAVEV